MNSIEDMVTAPPVGADTPDRRHMEDLQDRPQVEGIRLAAFKVGYAFMTSSIVATAVSVAAQASARPLFYSIALTLATVGLLALLAWRVL